MTKPINQIHLTYDKSNKETRKIPLSRTRENWSTSDTFYFSTDKHPYKIHSRNEILAREKVEKRTTAETQTFGIN